MDTYLVEIIKVIGYFTAGVVVTVLYNNYQNNKEVLETAENISEFLQETKGLNNELDTDKVIEEINKLEVKNGTN